MYWSPATSAGPRQSALLSPVSAPLAPADGTKTLVVQTDDPGPDGADGEGVEADVPPDDEQATVTAASTSGANPRRIERLAMAIGATPLTGGTALR